MFIQIREGSAAKNLDDLLPLFEKYADKIMFCSDDRHPNDLAEKHINDHVRRAVAAGHDPIEVLRACTLNPIMHYGLDVGLLRENDPADFLIVDNLTEFNVLETYIDGTLVAEQSVSHITSVKEKVINKFDTVELGPDDIIVPATGRMLSVIRALDGQLVTEEIDAVAQVADDQVVSSIEKDILKMVVYNRYEHVKPSVAFIQQFGLKKGAIASTVAHDSHNIIAVGTNDADICRAINLLVKSKGGVSLVDDDNEMLLPLPVAGLMSNRDAYEVAMAYDELDKEAKSLGSALNAPYMTLSFMALLVIPDIKLSDKGLFDGRNFEFIPLIK
jgi:adenine deaminase